MRSLLFILIFLLTCLHGFSQKLEIQARVVDSASLEPVAFSTIYIDEHTGTITGELGFFRLEIPPGKIDDTLHVSCIGYTSRYILVRELQRRGFDSIYLRKSIVGLSEVQVTAKGARMPGSRQIIRTAIKNIPDNYPEEPVLYNGYYREYCKQEDAYINLFESIINLWDPGFQSYDNFQAGLQYKRINRAFPVDSSLLRPYDNLNKLVPYSRMPITLPNELVILRAHDPVRNYDHHSFYFVDRLEKDFIRHHDFSRPSLTYLNDHPYYFIRFTDNRHYSISNNRVTAEGEVYIDALDYSFRRIRYRASIDRMGDRRKLFEVNLEYTPSDHGCLLHYLSFNNLFYTRNFYHSSTSLYEDRLQLAFNKPVDPASATPEHISVFLQGQEQKIRNIRMTGTGLSLTFTRKSPITERLKMNLLPRTVQTRKKIADNEKSLMNDLHFEFRNFRDTRGESLADKEFNEYYQYREFFTDSTSFDRQGIKSNLVNKFRPVIENKIFGNFTVDTSRMNTPLIREQILAGALYNENSKPNRYISGQFKRNENHVDEIVYVQTDREVYAPEDTLWFKAYIRDKRSLGTSDLSRLFYFIFADADGSVIERQKYLVDSSGVNGQLFLANTLSEGVYYILGYSSWMTNFEPEGMFCKRIMVLREKRDGLLLAAEFDKEAYLPGDTVRMLVNCYDEFNHEVDDVDFRYRFAAGSDILSRGRGSTEKSWLYPVNFVVPEDLDTTLEVQLLASYKLERLDTAWSVPVKTSVHINFFPEGGQCFNGIETVMAFKATDDRGNPLEVSGQVIDRDGKVLATADSRHDGMGSFRYIARANRSAVFRLTRPGILNASFPLPEAQDRGWQMHATQSEDKKGIEVGITNVNSGNDTALLTLRVRDYLSYYHLIVTGRKSTVSIPFTDIPPGIGVLTLLDHDLMPRAERLIRIPAEREYNPVITSDRQRYLTRDSVVLTLGLNGEGNYPPKGTYSLSVIDDQLCTTSLLDEPDIETSLLVSPEIRGPIHDPEHYFDRTDPDAARDLDLLLLTQGWRNYKFPEEEKVWSAGTKPENRDGIDGLLLKQPFASDRKPAEGQLSVFFGGNTTKIPVGEDGAFSFLPDYSMENNSEILMFAEDKRGRRNLSIALNSTDFEQNLNAWLSYLADSLSAHPLNYSASRERLQDRFSLALENHQWLEEVTIRKTVEKKQLERTDLANTKRKATQEEIDMAYDMEDLASMVYAPNPFNATPYYCIDGILQYDFLLRERDVHIMIPDYSRVQSMLPSEVAEYTVMSGPEIQGLYGTGIDYVIDIKTKDFENRPSDWKYDNPVTIGKLALVKEFYRPVYDTPEKRQSQIPDLRKTILWDPGVKVDLQGNARVKFYNGDRYTRIRCILEGITGEGIPVHAEHTYEVGLSREE